ncbi:MULTISPECIES: S26 family signal peptidase [Xanthomonas]|uniref:S26 family signal peptidase n=1 Tax=Xanthomonas TaxID=338 RepID=UPI001883EC4C|nr:MULTISPECIES: S26 family signal peptidase [Xanthomonas]QOX05501.1 S26 family signal peptidase [Xanthomonas sp. WG16]QXF04498.1 S26 family signal peptidase [Xanthomonas citri pv. citri]
MSYVQTPVCPRWSARFVKNLFAVLAISTMVAVSYVQSTYTLGFDLQATRCLPWSVYWVTRVVPEEVKRGILYQYRFTGDEKLLGRNLVKFAAAVPGDRIKLDPRGVWINGEYWGPMHPLQVERLIAAGQAPFASFVVPKGKVLMLGTLPQTYDSRYVGLVDISALNGTATPLW